MNRRSLSTIAILGIASSLLIASGCTDNGIATVPVQGRITYAGGDWPKAGTLYFVPIESRGPISRPAMAKFDKHGRFSVQTFTDGDGLIPGRYQIKVECWEHPPSLSPDAPEARSYVPEAIQLGKAEGWTIDVSADQTVADLALDVPKI